jgi:hypothetical protein
MHRYAIVVFWSEEDAGAVAEEGSLTVAAERRLHTPQPSLSPQIRDLE